MIQVYKADNTNYDKNGDMTLTPTACELSSEINGAWELTMSHPIDDEGRWKYLSEEAVISAPTFQGKHQLFRVDKCVKTDSSVEVTAYPIFFDSADDCFLMDIRPTQKSGQEALDIMTAGSIYSGQSDITTGGTAYFVRRNLMDAINGEDEPTFTQIWGGEILYDNHTVIINERIGSNKGLEIRYGKNMESVSSTVDMSNVVTRIVPVAYNGRMISGSGSTLWVDSPNINKYAKTYIREMTFEDVRLKSDVEDSDLDNEDYIICETQAELNQALEDKCQAEYDAGIDLPSITIEIDVAALEYTEQYKDIKDLVKIGLGDDVHCYNHLLNIETTARAIKMTWDCIRDRVSSVVLGDYAFDYFARIMAGTNRINGIVRPDGSIIAEKVQGIIDAKWSQLVFSSAVDGFQDYIAVLVENTDLSSENYGAVSLGSKGLQVATSRTVDGTSWDWKTVVNQSGSSVDELTGVIKDRASISTWNLDNGDLSMSGVFRNREDGLVLASMENGQFTLFNTAGRVIGFFRTDGLGAQLGSGGKLEIGIINGYGFTPVLSYDPGEADATPEIINTEKVATLFPDNKGGGVVIENGLVKSAGLKAYSGTIDTGSERIQVTNGLITAVETVET